VKKTQDVKTVARLSEKSLSAIWDNPVDAKIWNNFSATHPIRD
jgi:hypothetical protein